MIVRRFATLVCCAAVLVVFPGGNAGAAVSRRVVVVVVDGTSVRGWVADPGLAAIARAGSIGLLGTRAGTDEDEPGLIRAASLASLGAGARVPAGDRSGGDLTAALDRARVSYWVHPSLRGVLDPSAHGAAATGSAAVAIMYARDVREGGWIASHARQALGPRDLLAVVSPTATPLRQQEHLFLSAAVFAGEHVSPGLLYSPTTRRLGMGTLTDIAPTILDALGIDLPRAMTGRPLEFRPESGAVPRVLRLESDLVRASHARSFLVRMMMIAAMVLVGGAGLAIGMGWTDGRRRGRAVLGGLLCALCALPLAMLVSPLLPGGRPAEVALWVGVAAAVAGISAAVFVGPERGIGLLGGVTAAAVLVDLATGGALASRSPLSYLLAQGARFYGIGNEFMGVVIGGALVAVAASVGRDPGRKRVSPLVAVGLAAAVALMSAPAFGAKFGATLTAIPAFGVLLARATDRRLGARFIAGLAAFTGMTTAAVYLADRMRAPSARSHIGSVGRAAEGSVIARKLSAARALIAFSIWMKAIVVFAAAVGFVWWKKRDAVRALLRERPGVRGALHGGVVAAGAAVVFNDAGMIAAAIIAMFVSAAVLVSDL